MREDLLDAKEAKKRIIKGIVTIPADPFEMAEQAATLFDLNEYIYQRIWLTFMDDHDIPDDFEDTAYSNDAAPSISHTSGRIMVWFHDRDTWDDIGWHDELKKYQVHYHPTEQAYGEYGEGYTNKSVNTWAEVLEIIEEWRKTQTELEQRIFRFHDGDDSCNINALEILTNNTEEDEPELYKFARTAKVGDFLSGANVNGPDVSRIQ